ncbi:MAG TPA: hypothetical protein VG651_24915 [Stellaceae bacterium]|nr:hypothetical protein [Stellaceae bacterium]
MNVSNDGMSHASGMAQPTWRDSYDETILMKNSYPRILAIVRAGRNAIHKSWTYRAKTLIDIAVLPYEETGYGFDDTDIVYIPEGRCGKFQGIKKFFVDNPDILEKYDYFWCLDDDIYIPYTSLVSLKCLLASYAFHLAAPSLETYSYCNWQITVRNKRFLFRGTDFVEVMVPLMSREFLLLVLPHFDENFSSWGYEFLWRKFLREKNWYAAMLDAAPVVHTRPPRMGSTYSNLPPGTMTAGDEARALVQKFGLEDTPFFNFFGVTAGEPSLVYGAPFVELMAQGYNDTDQFNSDDLHRWLMSGLERNMPKVDLDFLTTLDGFHRVLENLRRIKVNGSRMRIADISSTNASAAQPT